MITTKILLRSFGSFGSLQIYFSCIKQILWITFDTIVERKFHTCRSSMLSIKMITFCKSANCPASQELLAFQKGEATIKESNSIRNHLKSCEFCATEVEFYEHFPQSEENVVSVEIPLPLLQLAETLLNNRRHQDISLLNKLLTNTEAATA